MDDWTYWRDNGCGRTMDERDSGLWEGQWIMGGTVDQGQWIMGRTVDHGRGNGSWEGQWIMGGTVDHAKGQ